MEQIVTHLAAIEQALTIIMYIVVAVAAYRLLDWVAGVVFLARKELKKELKKQQQERRERRSTVI